jgi:adenosylhomocysteine nucleosidase
MKIGLLYAMPGEIESLLEASDAQLLQEVAGCRFYQLQREVIACTGGVSKVNAAMATQLMISLYAPDLIVNIGVAGCFEDLPIGTLVLAEDFVQHDVDTTAVGDPIGLVSTVNLVSFPTSDPELAKAAMDRTGYTYRVGRVATGDWFAVAGERAAFIRDTFHPLLCEMEGGAAAQVCGRNGVKFMALKSVSDCLFGKEKDYVFNFPAAMKDLNHAALKFIDALEEL